MNLRIFGILDINKGVRSNPDTQPVDIYKDGESICIESPDYKVVLRFTLEELRAIMRLFDAAKEEKP